MIYIAGVTAHPAVIMLVQAATTDALIHVDPVVQEVVKPTVLINVTEIVMENVSVVQVLAMAVHLIAPELALLNAFPIVEILVHLFARITVIIIHVQVVAVKLVEKTVIMDAISAA